MLWISQAKDIACPGSVSTRFYAILLDIRLAGLHECTGKGGSPGDRRHLAQAVAATSTTLPARSP